MIFEDLSRLEVCRQLDPNLHNRNPDSVQEHIRSSAHKKHHSHDSKVCNPAALHTLAIFGFDQREAFHLMLTCVSSTGQS